MDKKIRKLKNQKRDAIKVRVRANNGEVNTKVWMNSGMDYLFPEMQLPEPPSLTAICFSGGGTRAMTATMGQLRAMNHNQAVDKAGYISCVSGGSWASVIYTYYQCGAMDDHELLGPKTEPEDICQKDLKELPSCRLAYGASLDFLKKLGDGLDAALEGREDPHRVWIDTVGEIFTARFGLYDKDKSMFFTLNEVTEQDIRQRNQNNSFVTENDFIKPHKDRPFLVVNSSLLWPDNVLDPQLTSFEYTPLATGNPYGQELEDKSIFKCTKRWVGGGVIESFAFGCGSPGNKLESKGEGEHTLNLQAPATPFGITDATGTSSAAYSADFAEIYTIVSPEMPYWPVLTYGNEHKSTREHTTYFGDGGSLDNMGLISMLRRGVKSALVFINTSTVLEEGYTGDHWPDALEPQIDTDFAKLFGYDPQRKAYDNRVFTRPDFKKVVTNLQHNRASGGPIASWCHLTVQENKNWGIPGGNDIFVVFVYLGRCEKWECKLPTETRNWMDIGCGTTFKDFPNYATVGEDWRGVLHFRLIQLEACQVNALADLSFWVCQQLLSIEEVKDGLLMDRYVRPDTKICSASHEEKGA